MNQSKLLRHPEIRHVGSVQSPTSELFVTAQVWAESKPIGVSVQTPHTFFKTNRAWNKWLELPVSVRECPISTQIAITIWDLSPISPNGSLNHSTPFGGTTISLFEQDGTLRKGRQKCKVYRKKLADGQTPSTTPHIPAPKRRQRNEEIQPAFPEAVELERLENLFKKHEMNEIPQVDWLDQLVFKKVAEKAREVDEVARKREALRKLARQAAQRRIKSGQRNGIVNGTNDSDDEFDSGDDLDEEERFTLYVDFPRWDFPVIFQDHEYEPSRLIKEFQSASTTSGLNPKAQPEVRYGPDIAAGNVVVDDEDHPVIQIFDPEQFQRENPCEMKHRRLVRSERNSQPDTDMKPNAKLRDELNEILSYGPTQDLTPQEKDLLWTFRRHLSREKRALTKVVKATDWSSAKEARALIDLIPKWAEIDVDSALELLGPTYSNPVVRAYAVDRLRKADDHELQLYLLQLVQALKFEKQEGEEEGLPASSLARFLIDRAANNFYLGNFLHWFLMVECGDRGPETNAANRKLFARVEYHFMLELEKRDPEQRKILLRQAELITIITKLAKDIRFGRDNRIHKIERLKKSLADPKNELVTINPPIPLPLDPGILVTGVSAEEANVFKSSLSPLLLWFKVTSAPQTHPNPSPSPSTSSTTTKYPVIFKTGDDLRQDQLVIQIITLIDSLLQKKTSTSSSPPIVSSPPTRSPAQYNSSTPPSPSPPSPLQKSIEAASSPTCAPTTPTRTAPCKSARKPWTRTLNPARGTASSHTSSASGIAISTTSSFNLPDASSTSTSASSSGATRNPSRPSSSSARKWSRL